MLSFDDDRPTEMLGQFTHENRESYSADSMQCAEYQPSPKVPRTDCTMPNSPLHHSPTLPPPPPTRQLKDCEQTPAEGPPAATGIVLPVAFQTVDSKSGALPGIVDKSMHQAQNHKKKSGSRGNAQAKGKGKKAGNVIKAPKAKAATKAKAPQKAETIKGLSKFDKALRPCDGIYRPHNAKVPRQARARQQV